jgi:hypothetical protein
MILDDSIISFTNLNLISIEVTNKISSKYLNEFIKTSLKTHNISLEPHSKIFIKFIQEANIYEIYIINTLINNPFIMQQIFKSYYKKDNTISIDIFITKDFFVVYKNKEFYLSKKNKQYTKNDIINYLKFTYKLQIDNIYMIDDEELKRLKQAFLNNSYNLEYISFNNHGYIYFLLYFLTSVVFSAYIFYYQPLKYSKIQSQQPNIISNDIKQLQNLKQQYKKLSTKVIKNKQLSKKIIELFNYLKLNKIHITKIEYKQQLYITIVAKQKKFLYDFLAIYDKKIKIINLIKLEDNKNFSMDIQIEF